MTSIAMAPSVPEADYVEMPCCYILHYMNEGGANVIYRIVVLPGTTASPVRGAPACVPGNGTSRQLDDPGFFTFDQMLLRLRKDLPITMSSAQIHDSWHRQIVPLLKGDVLKQFLVKLPGGLTETLSSKLQSCEKYDYGTTGPFQTHEARPSHRRGVYLAPDDFGILVEDMTPKLSDEFLIEFKPKWLVQSPTASSSAVRCRTCALTARKNAHRAAKGDELISGFCPLDLTSKDHRCLSHVAKQLTRLHNLPEEAIDRFVSYLQECSILDKLSGYQKEFDPLGVFEADPKSDSFLKAMALRDCSMFVQISTDPQQPIIAKLGDLDMKSPEKVAYWRSVEQPLISEGWYEGTEQVEERQPVTCALAAGRWEEIEKLEVDIGGGCGTATDLTPD